MDAPSGIDMSGELVWYRAAVTRDVPLEDVIRVEIGGRGIALYNVEGRFYASDDACTHQRSRLSDGFVIDHVIECSRHQGRFDIRTGRALGAPVSRALAVHPVKVEGEVIYVGLSAAGGGSA
jgi:naphthalene 1,2-dioxygenase system ferredoxin subunit